MNEATPSPTAAQQLPVVVPASADAVIAIETQESSLHAKIQALVVNDDDGLAAASELLASNSYLQKVVEEDLGTPKKAARSLWQSMNDLFNKYMKPLQDDEKVLKRKISDHLARVEQERQRQIEAARRQAEARAADEDARLEHAAALEAAGDHEGAAEVLDEEPAPAPAPIAQKKVEGLSARDNWKAQIVSIEKMIHAASAGDPNALAILTDEKVVEAATRVASQAAKGLKAKFRCDGVRVYNDRVVSRR